LPAVSEIILLMVPYSDSDTQGIAYSESISRDLAQVLLPPQNIVILRRNEQITLSWDAIPNASGYKIYTNRGVIQTASTLYSVPIGAEECTQLQLSTVRGGKESQTVELESCE
ncbi:MAG: hypothetical protein LBV04_08795, partial [Deferribacteraceae bacterium]|nr:hypothetical protein [Deferribacteraceae bacterium]